MFAALCLAAQAGAGHGFEVFDGRGLFQPVEHFKRLCIMAERKERNNGVPVVVFMQDVKGFRIPALLQQIDTPHISRIDLAGVNGVLYHSLPAQVVSHGNSPKPRVNGFFKVAIIRRVSVAD